MYPILLKIGPVEIRTYGFFVGLAFLVALLMIQREATRKGLFPDRILDLGLLILISGVIGARALHVLVNLDYYSRNVAESFMFWRGGLAFHGGLIGAVAASLVFIWSQRLPVWKVGDLFAPYAALGQSIGRIGCFLNGCCYGAQATLSLPGVIFPDDTVYRHPVQIYASAALLGIFVVLKLIGKRGRHPDGTVFWSYVTLYGLVRFAMDFLRGDTPKYAGGLTVPQMISVVLFLVGGIVLVILRGRKDGRDSALR
jgi:phosphatidylglycerol:prolipoprotein diacylglycerol transferase